MSRKHESESAEERKRGWERVVPYARDDEIVADDYERVALRPWWRWLWARLRGHAAWRLQPTGTRSLYRMRASTAGLRSVVIMKEKDDAS